jgi:hypothetical protein
MNCRTCKHWAAPYDERDPQFDRFRECDKAARHSELVLHERKHFATCLWESIAGELFTRDDYGCVEYEAADIIG